MPSKPYIIAEIASAHEGNLNLLRKLLNAAIKSQADAVKFQVFKTDELIASTNPLYTEFRKIEINSNKWKIIFNELKRKKIDVIYEIFDYESISLIKNFRGAVKIPSASVADKKFLKKISSLKRRIFLAVGGSDINEISNAIKILKAGKANEIILQCGFQNFPTKISDSNLAQIKYLHKNFALPIAYADHVDAEDYEMRFLIPALAYSMGASFIEKHITIDRAVKGRDYYSALNPKEFREFVIKLKSLSDVFGNPKLIGRSKAEIKYKAFSKKFAVASRDIKSGTKCDLKYFKFLRTGKVGISEDEFKKYENKTITKNLRVNDILKSNNFK